MSSAELLATPPVEFNAAIKGRVRQFDGLRALAFGSVLLNHATHLPLLWAGVDVFFVLSGFLITGILLERKQAGGSYFGRFYRRRFFRIVPSYVVVIVLYGLMFTWREYKPVWLFLLAPNIHSLGTHTPELPLWSLAVEEQFYLVWPVIVLFTSEATLLRLSVAAVVLTPILRAVCTPLFPNHFYIYCLTPFRADLLCAGAVLALLWKRRTVGTAAEITRWAPLVCLVGFALFISCQAFSAFHLARNTALANALVYSFSLIGSVGLLAWALTGTGRLRTLLLLPPLRYLGEISYTMYLVHIFLIVRLQNSFGMHVWVKALGVLVVVLYASASWFLMERPLIRFAARSSRVLPAVR